MTLIDSNVTIDVTYNNDYPNIAKYHIHMPLSNGESISFSVTELDMMGIIHVFSHALYEKVKEVTELEESKIKKKKQQKNKKQKEVLTG
jgi:hypothetical protein